MHAHELEQALVPQDGETLVFDTNPVLNERVTHYCPGCHHGIAHRLVSEVLHELGVADRTILVASVGCATFTYDYFNVDGLEAPHGRACAVATGVRRARPESVVFTYQGDGDMGAIGLAESIHAANRGELITGIFINNTVYGMTGGQMAPTTLIGQKATTCQTGRTKEQAGMPIRMAEMLSTLDGCVYAERVCVTDIANINKAKKAIKKAFQKQMNGEGFTFIEVLSTCPTNWGMTPLKAVDWLKDNMNPYYPLGVIKEVAPENAEVK